MSLDGTWTVVECPEVEDVEVDLPGRGLRRVPAAASARVITRAEIGDPGGGPPAAPGGKS